MAALLTSKHQCAKKLPIIILVFDDGEIGHEPNKVSKVSSHGVHLGGIDWEHLFRGFGANGTSVDNEAALLAKSA